jgi:hypothetical protein
MIRTYKEMITPDAEGRIETGANVTLTIALAALVITAQLERVAKALEERNALDRRI